MAGFWYSTRQVGKSATEPWRSRRIDGRCSANQVENRWRAYGGSTRSAAMPTVFCMILRVSEPGVPMARLARGAAATLSLPMRSVRASAWFCTLALTGVSPDLART